MNIRLLIVQFIVKNKLTSKFRNYAHFEANNQDLLVELYLLDTAEAVNDKLNETFFPSLTPVPTPQPIILSAE